MAGVSLVMRSKYRDRRDNHVEFRLINWGRAVNKAWTDGPRRNAHSQSWHEQIESGYAGEEDPPVPVDFDDAEQVQHGMIRCMISDMETAMLLTRRYRDDWNITGLRKLRNKFWKYL